MVLNETCNLCKKEVILNSQLRNYTLNQGGHIHLLALKAFVKKVGSVAPVTQKSDKQRITVKQDQLFRGICI